MGVVAFVSRYLDAVVAEEAGVATVEYEEIVEYHNQGSVVEIVVVAMEATSGSAA